MIPRIFQLPALMMICWDVFFWKRITVRHRLLFSLIQKLFLKKWQRSKT